MSDLASRLLAAIGEAEQDARAWKDSERNWKVVGRRTLRYDNGRTEDVVAIDVSGRTADFWERIYVKRDLDGLAAHVARNDPAAVLRRCAADFRTWDRHKPFPHRLNCTHDGQRWPCLDFRDLADRYGLSVEEETTHE